MSQAAIHTSASRSSSGSARRGVEYEFARLTLSRDLSRGFVARLLTDRAEHGGWELDRVRVLADGTRKVVLRRTIIRQPRPAYAG